MKAQAWPCQGELAPPETNLKSEIMSNLKSEREIQQTEIILQQKLLKTTFIISIISIIIIIVVISTKPNTIIIIISACHLVHQRRSSISWSFWILKPGVDNQLGEIEGGLLDIMI